MPRINQHFVFQGILNFNSLVFHQIFFFLHKCRVVVQGQGPGPRYGHVMDLVAQRYLVTVSGNDGEGDLLFNQFYLCDSAFSLFFFLCSFKSIKSCIVIGEAS